jgi:hypothetical protein
MNRAKRLRINPLMVSPSNHWNNWNKLSWVAVGDVPDVAGYKMTVSTRHLFSLEAHFAPQKVASKPLTDAFYAIFD